MTGQMTWHDYGDDNPRDGGLLNCCGVMVGLALAGAVAATGVAILWRSRSSMPRSVEAR